MAEIHGSQFHDIGIDAAFFVGSAGARKVFVLAEAQVGDIEQWFVIGDIHGDFYALYNLTVHIATLCPEFRLLFLGDLVDRGPHPEACFYFLAKLAAELPGRVVWLAGNHDVGLAFDQTTEQFKSDVAPSEFVAFLNADHPQSARRKALGLKFIEIAQKLPRAVIFQSGLLATHGGIPHTDLQKQLPSSASQEEVLAWLNSPDALKDFTWTRISRYKSKLPNRYSTGCQYGYADFAAFCATTEKLLAVRNLLTGHEHPDCGFDLHPEWTTHRALTLTGFGFGHDSGSAHAFQEGYRANILFARLKKDAFPEVMIGAIDRQDLQLFFDVHLAASFVRASEKNVDLG